MRKEQLIEYKQTNSSARMLEDAVLSPSRNVQSLKYGYISTVEENESNNF